LIGYATAIHYRHHLEPLGLEITDRRVTNHPRVVVASRKDARKMEPVKTAEVAVVEHGAGQRYHIDAGGPESPHPNVTLFLAPSKRVARQSQHLWPEARSVVVGSPRLEYLASLDRAPARVVIAFHWNSPVCPESLSAWKHYQSIIPLLDGYPLLGHGHPAMRGHLKGWYLRQGVQWEDDWAECVKQAAVLVCDNSSIMWEACALGIPVVVLNAPWYRRDVDWPPRFWRHADIGPQVEHASELRAAVDQAATNDRWEGRRRRAAEWVYDRVEGSTEAAVAVLGEWT